MKKWSFAALSALFATMFMAGSAIATANDDLTDYTRKELRRHHHGHCGCHKKCLSERELTKQFRKWEALDIVQDLNSQVTNALDKVLQSNGPGDPVFEENINFVLSLQLDPENMDITIDIFHITNAEEFRNAWALLTQFYKYRKRSIVNYILADYKDEHCLRTIDTYAIGQNFIMLEYLPGEQPTGFPPGPPWHTSLNAVDFDRFQIIWQEIPREEGHDCAYNFRVKSLQQITESSFPLPDYAVIVDSQLAPDAQAVFDSHPCPSADGSGSGSGDNSGD